MSEPYIGSLLLYYCLKKLQIMEFYLVTTDHTEDRIWFRDEEDFKVGMNTVAVIACILSVNVAAFILMSNHAHFVLQCTYEQARRFITEFKRMYSRYLYHKYKVKDMLRRNDVDIRPLGLDDESLERAIAYVQMNSVAANICLTAADYPWGSGNAFFNASAEKGLPLDSLTGRDRIRLLHCKKDLPSKLRIGSQGYLLPSSYIMVKFVESLFRSPKRMMYFLQSSSKARLRLERVEGEGPSFRDQIIAAAMSDLSRTLFRKESFQVLSEAEKAETLKQVRYRFSANVNQIARVAGLSYDETVRLLDTL